MESLIVKIVKKAKELYKNVSNKSREAWYNTMRTAAKMLKSNEQIQKVKTTITAYMPYHLTAEKRSMLACIASIGKDALEVGNEFIASVCNSVCKFKNISEKQAYVIARFYVEQKLNYGNQYYFNLLIID